MARFVFDTGVVVSRLLYPLSIPAQALTAARKTGVILMSDDMQRELVEVLSRYKFARYASEEEIKNYIQSYISDTEYVSVTSAIRACSDANDDKVLELAVSGNADMIITSDHDLLNMNPFRNVEIITPREFLDRA